MICNIYFMNFFDFFLSFNKKFIKMSICLTMIVKNEEKNITRLFDSVYKWIDTFSICDTGSTDRTINVIQNYFQIKNIKGKVYSHPFENFEKNRNWILQKSFGKSDFLLLLDADMTLYWNNFDKEKLEKNCYYQFYQGNNDFSYLNTRLIPSHPDIHYVGVTHEYISIPQCFQQKIIPKEEMFIFDHGDGGCKENKFKRDIDLLEKKFQEDPKDSRTIFYLANSFYDIREYSKAITYYKKRIELKGWNEEIWYSHFRLGLIYKATKHSSKAVHHWLECIQYNSHRIENIHEIIKLYRQDCKYHVAYSFYKMLTEIISKDVSVYNRCLFFHNSVYDYEVDYEYTIIAFYNNVSEIQKPTINILNYTDKYTQNLLSNYKYYNNHLLSNSCIDLSETFPIDKIGDFYSSSASILSKSNNEYFLLVRYVNYKVCPNGSYCVDDNIISTYKLHILNSSFDILQTKEMKFPEKKEFKHFYVGNEDIRLFQFENDIYTIGTTFIQNATTQICVGTGKLKDKESNLDLRPITKSSVPLEQCEKNWVYCTYENKLHIIYKWFPLQICCLQNDNFLQCVKEIEVPNFFKIIRGSSCGFVFENETWFVCHAVSHEKPREYYHIFVVFDSAMTTLVNYTPLLKFSKKPIEYVLSLIVTDTTIIVPYSVMDGATKIGTFDKKYIESFFYKESKN